MLRAFKWNKLFWFGGVVENFFCFLEFSFTVSRARQKKLWRGDFGDAGNRTQIFRAAIGTEFDLSCEQRRKTTAKWPQPDFDAVFRRFDYGRILSLIHIYADGSVYQGSLLTNNLVSQNHVLTAVLRGTTQNQVSPGAKKEDVAGNNYYFRVSGQNRTSKQNVVFSGNLIPLAGGAVNSQVAPSVNNSAVHGEMSQPQNAALFSNSRIAGTATVNTTNKIEINAMPTTP